MRVLSDGRVRRSRSEWQTILERYEASGLTESAFCRRAKLSRSTFVNWKRRLASEPRPAGRPAFVEWLAPAGETSPAPGGPGSSFELELPGGVVLRWKA